MGIAKLIRVYFISNGWDDCYLVFTNDIKEYQKRMMAYISNLTKSSKCNYYNFGTIEITEDEYLRRRLDAVEVEDSLVEEKNKKIRAEEAKKKRRQFRVIE